MDVDNVKKAIEAGGSIRAAAALLNTSYTNLQWWLARNGYKITKSATIEAINTKKVVKS